MRKCISSGSLCSLHTARDFKRREHTDAAFDSGTTDGGCSEQSVGKEGCDRTSSRRTGKGGTIGPWLVKCSPAAKRPGPAPEIDAELWKLHNLWRERQQGEGRHQGECCDSVSSFERDGLPSLTDRRCSGSGELVSDLTKRDSDSSAWSDSSHCSLGSLTDARQVAFIRKARDVPGRAASLPEALPHTNARYVTSARGSRAQAAQMEARPERRSLDSDGGSEMDADCCGDSGAISLRGARAHGSNQLSVSTAAHPNSTGTIPFAIGHHTSDEESDRSSPGTPRSLSRWHSSVYVSEGQAAVELFFRLNHARQTMDYVRRQAAMYAKLEKREMGVWEAMAMLGTLREFETALLQEEGTDADLPLPQHAMQTAENCRAAFPDLDWLHLVGLIHSLGKVLAHKQMGAEPQWAVSGESFPVGCRFHPAIACSQFFSVNPDRRRRMYSTSTGVYKEHCGLGAVHMSWSASEYLYMVLLLNRTKLPAEALFLIRHQRFFTLNRPGQPYAELLCEGDRVMVPWLARFRELSAYKRAPDQAQPGRLTGQAFREYYNGLIRKYIPSGTLRW